MISILCPSRGRPDRFKVFFESVKRTSQAEVFLYLDEDDPTIEEYPDIRNKYIGKPMHLGPAYQFLYENTSTPYIQMGADDLIYKTKDWDKEVVKYQGVVSFDDGGRPRKEDGHPFISREFIEKIGYLTNPKLSHSCVDNFIVDIAKAVKMYHKIDINIEHVHPKYNKAEWDETYRRNTGDLKKHDGYIYKTLRHDIKNIVGRFND